ncbi:MAG: IS66 family transposase, partial [Pirellulaceae bacterium]|nr:IS66 family transposase [Pirellulaceae bacterium]
TTEHKTRTAQQHQQPAMQRLLAENGRLRRQLQAAQEELEAVRTQLQTTQQQLNATRQELKAAQQRAKTAERQLRAAQREVERLRQTVEKLGRAAKRQAAPFRKQDQPSQQPKKPGRKRGRRHGQHAHRTPPPQIDEHYDVPLPDACPHCGGGHLEETAMATQYQTEIPRRPIYRQFDIHIGKCCDCGRRVQGRHELQTSDALGAASSQLGPDAHAAVVILNKELGLSHGKCARLFDRLFGIKIARATSIRSILRTAQLATSAQEQAKRDIRGSPFVVPDETGWRVGGRNAWLHVMVGDTATCYKIGRRSGDVAETLLGSDWSNTMIHDGWSAYNRFRSAFHQQCIHHLKRRCERLLKAAVGVAARLPQAVLQLIEEAFCVRRGWRGHRISTDESAMLGLDLTCRLEKLTQGRFCNKENRKLADHILKHALHWFWFLIDPKIDATNYRAEQALRFAVVNRKVWGGNRTPRGADAQGITLTLGRTLEQRGHCPVDWFSRLRRTPGGIPLPDPVR